MSRRSALLCCCLLAVASCRDGVRPFATEPFRSGTPELRRLTFGAGNDMDPRWSPGGDSIYYHSDAWFDLPARGALLRVAADGGTARLAAPGAQPGTSSFLAHPAPAPGDGRLAYLQFVRVVPPVACPEQLAPIPPEFPDTIFCERAEPMLDSAVLRVRLPGARGQADEDAGVGLRFPGVDPRQWRRDTTRLRQTLYPFEEDWIEAADMTSLRASWSPDGQRVVFSNGIQLFAWRVGEPAATALPNTADGVAPAWSPDGERIAFVINVRGPATEQTCVCAPFPKVPNSSNLVVHYRTAFAVAQRQLALVRPDGSGLVLLGEGRDPAWSPDGRTLYFARGDGDASAIYRTPADGSGSAAAVPDTERGRAPAVSPDGRYLAFARRSPPGLDSDIWVKRITP